MMFWMLPALACEAFDPLAELASLQHPQLTESSGLAAGRRTDGSIWTHDDSGEAALFRFSLDGTVTEHLVSDADNKDWEDIASADCPGSGSCLYVGDIGIDRSQTGEITVYVVREPKNDGPGVLIERWELLWPGAARDAETLLIHPCTLEGWIITKGTPTEVFRIPDKRGHKPLELEPVTTLDIEEDVTGGDIAPDGSAVVLRSDDRAWTLTTDWGPSTELVSALPPGEGVAWDLDGDLIFSAEGFPTALSRMACAAPAPEVCSAPGCGCTTSTRLFGLYPKRR